MSDSSTEAVEGDGPPTYPDGSVGMLMRDRDLARANATAARDQADRFAALATDADTRADALQVAIDALSPGA